MYDCVSYYSLDINMQLSWSDTVNYHANTNYKHDALYNEHMTGNFIAILWNLSLHA